MDRRVFFFRFCVLTFTFIQMFSVEEGYPKGENGAGAEVIMASIDSFKLKDIYVAHHAGCKCLIEYPA